MPPDIVIFFSDVDGSQELYLPLIRKSLDSARDVMPQSRRVLLTTTPSAELRKGFDVAISIDEPTTRENLCLHKAQAIITWQAQMDRPCVFIDPDVILRFPVPMIEEDVGLLWRKSSAQPVNAGLLMAKPGCPEFWRKYGVTCSLLPKALHAWWCDQLAFSVMIGAIREAGEVVQAHDAKVRLIPWEMACAPPEKAHEDVWAWHFKGARKGPEWERPVAELLEAHG